MECCFLCLGSTDGRGRLSMAHLSFADGLRLRSSLGVRRPVLPSSEVGWTRVDRSAGRVSTPSGRLLDPGLAVELELLCCRQRCHFALLLTKKFCVRLGRRRDRACTNAWFYGLCVCGVIAKPTGMCTTCPITESVGSRRSVGGVHGSQSVKIP